LAIDYLSTMKIRELKKDFSRNAKHKRINGFGKLSEPGKGVCAQVADGSPRRIGILSARTTVDLLDAAATPNSVGRPIREAAGKFRRPAYPTLICQITTGGAISKVSEGRDEFTGIRYGKRCQKQTAIERSVHS